MVKRIVTNIGAGKSNIDIAKAFYGRILGLTIAMDLGWIITFEAHASTTPQISIAIEGGSGTAVPDITIEVYDLEDVYQRVVHANLPIEYGPTKETWGVKRFFIRDPFGRLLNILVHC
ncbi:VOC family protein [Spirosoma arcticum]